MDFEGAVLRPQTETPRRKRAVQAGAVAASLVAHCALLLLLVGFGSNGAELLSGDGMGDVEAMEVSLVGGQAEAESEAPPVVDPAAELLARLGGAAAAPDSQPITHNAQSIERVSLSELLDEAASTSAGASRGQASASATQVQEGAKDARGKQTGSAQRARSGAAGSGGLWSVIEPCWKRQRTPLNAHARIVVKLDMMGRLAEPPQVIRTDDMRLDRDQMLAEDRAFAALTMCLPSAIGRFSGPHVLDFQRG